MKTAAEKLFVNCADEKELIAKISAICGIKQDVIRTVWTHTFFNTYLSILEQREKKLVEIKLPFMGKIMLRFNEENDDFEQFLLIDPNVRDIIKSLRTGNDTGLVSYFKEHFINRTIDVIKES